MRVGQLLLTRLRDELTGRDELILGFVGEFRLASARQLRRLFFPKEEFATAETAARCCRRVLTRLVRHRLLVRLERRVGGVRAGSDGYIYALGAVGFRLAHPQGRSRPRHWEPSSPFVDHQLAVSELAVELLLAERRGEIELLRLQGEPRSWRSLPGQRAHAGSLRPDLHLALRSREIELSWFVEVDRGTAHLPTLLGKCSLYEAYYRSGVEQASFGVFPRVLWITPTVTRMSRLQGAIAEDRQLTDALFAVTASEKAVDMIGGSGVAR